MAKVPAPCGQCGKPSVVTFGEAAPVPLCVDCWHKVESARTMSFRLAATMANAALDDMEAVVGLPGGTIGARIPLPPEPKGPVIFNNIKVDNSMVGAINTGNARVIDVSLTQLHNAGNDKARNALKALTETILAEKSLTPALRNELLEQVAFLSEQSIASAERRQPGLIKATLSYISQASGAVTAVATAWATAEPVLRAIFGL